MFENHSWPHDIYINLWIEKLVGSAKPPDAKYSKTEKNFSKVKRYDVPSCSHFMVHLFQRLHETTILVNGSDIEYIK